MELQVSERPMSIVKMHNKKAGVTYVYESTSYWDKEKQQPRNKRKLIGKIDPETGEIVPTGKPGRKSASAAKPAEAAPPIVSQTRIDCSDDRYDSLLASLSEKDGEIAELKKKVKTLEMRCSNYESWMNRIRFILDEQKDG